MNQIERIKKLADRRTSKVRKRDAKKRDIANSAIDALKTYGYARTTLRDIAAHSDMSLGSLHYYFEDKDELLVYCVRQYKLRFIELIHAAVAGVGTPDQALVAICRALAETIRDEAELHRLWYDIRNQAMFDETFVSVVMEIEELLIGMFSPIATNSTEKRIIYLRLDGAFRYLLQQHLSGSEMSLNEMQEILEASAASQLA